MMPNKSADKNLNKNIYMNLQLTTTEANSSDGLDHVDEFNDVDEFGDEPGESSCTLPLEEFGPDHGADKLMEPEKIDNDHKDGGGYDGIVGRKENSPAENNPAAEEEAKKAKANVLEAIRRGAYRVSVPIGKETVEAALKVLVYEWNQQKATKGNHSDKSRDEPQVINAISAYFRKLVVDKVSPTLNRDAHCALRIGYGIEDFYRLMADNLHLEKSCLSGSLEMLAQSERSGMSVGDTMCGEERIDASNMMLLERLSTYLKKRFIKNRLMIVKKIDHVKAMQGIDIERAIFQIDKEHSALARSIVQFQIALVSVRKPGYHRNRSN
ncbi:hypothetical protein BGX27_000707 [Mortierella sp. AM989]|nr:hypothetical protein BGX27_000707 [Mortierella sp. AM989]